jgi:hypothetical protein
VSELDYYIRVRLKIIRPRPPLSPPLPATRTPFQKGRSDPYCVVRRILNFHFSKISKIPPTPLSVILKKWYLFTGHKFYLQNLNHTLAKPGKETRKSRKSMALLAFPYLNTEVALPTLLTKKAEI